MSLKMSAVTLRWAFVNLNGITACTASFTDLSIRIVTSFDSLTRRPRLKPSAKVIQKKSSKMSRRCAGLRECFFDRAVVELGQRGVHDLADAFRIELAELAIHRDASRDVNRSQRWIG